MQKSQNKCKKGQISNFAFLSYGHLQAQKGKKSTIAAQNKQKSKRDQYMPGSLHIFVAWFFRQSYQNTKK
jgi:hypothetical protein